MSLWRQIARGLRALTDRRTVDRELDDEVRDYFERAREDLAKGGVSPKETARAARLAREQLREFGWENEVENTLHDLQQGARRMRSNPGFTLVVVLTLALGIGASAGIYSVVAPILFEPLPYPEGHRVAMVTDSNAEGGPIDVTFGTYIEVAARDRSFDALAVADRWQPTLVGAAEPERLIAELVSGDYFRVLGVAPAVGRDFLASDDTVGGPRVAIVTDGFAKRHFGSARAALDETIRLDGTAHTVIGVMPVDFDNVLAPAAELWAPRQYRPQAPFESAEWGHHMRMVGRLAVGVSVEQARDELAGIAGVPTDEFPRPPWAALEDGLHVESLQTAVTAGARPVLFAISGAVLLLLAIACANVANLLLARSVGWRNELAVRAALGAGRGRLARQLLTESLLLAVVSAPLGLASARLAIDAIVAIAPADLPRVDAIGLDVGAFAFALVLTTVVGLAVGLVSAVRGTRPDVRVELHAGSRTTGGSFHSLRRTLVVAEVALALVLLAGAGLLLRSVERLLSEPPGFDAEHVLTMQVAATSDGNDTREKRLQYFESLLASVRDTPGVSGAAFTSQLPLGGDFDGYSVVFEAASQNYPNDTDSALRYAVTPDWFRTMRIPLLSGRSLDARDRPDAPLAVLLSESFARSRFPGQSPIGERVRLGPDVGREDRPWGTVVGVVGDVKQSSLALAAPNAFYVATGQWNWVDIAQTLVVRTEGNPVALTPAIRRAISSVDPDAAVARITSMENLLAASEAERRFALTVFSLFAIAALLLAVLGLYGVIAGNVAERTREMGLRSALGATPGRIVSLITGQGMTLASLGIAFGLAVALTVTRGLETLLYGVTPLDPLTYAAVSLLLMAVCAGACWLPAARAARLDPTQALRSE